ncbi:polyprotein [Bradson virus]|uniref:polyprotein n=1 Tax=Bradson virus TaxID=1911438 RepID=UPI0008DB7359|nr:polyprotein [Bradson virus]AOX47514.1 polyprotein [Bradson virus]
MQYVANNNTNISLLDTRRGGNIDGFNNNSAKSLQTRHFSKKSTKFFNDRTISTTGTNGNIQRTSSFDSSFKEIFVRNAKIIPLCDFNFHLFDNWFNNLSIYAKEFGVRQTYGVNGERVSSYRFRYQLDRGTNAISVKGYEGSKEKQCYQIICQIWNQKNIVIQMDLGQGQTEGDESTRAGNTIMTTASTMDSDNTITIPDPITLSKLSNTEMTYEFPSITDRFQIFSDFKISTGNKVNELQKTYALPSALYSHSDVANLMPFKNFVYSDLDIEIRLVVNAPRFGCGKLIMASFPDSFDGYGKSTCWSECMLQRPGHVIIDLAKTNQGIIRIPNQYKRTFVRNTQSATSLKGIRTAEYATLQIEIFSQYKTGLDQPTTIPVQLSYRFVKAKFAGMSFGQTIEPQGLTDDLIDVGTTLVPAAKPLEKILKRVGRIINQDKPYGDNCSTIVPKPRDNFSAGVGISDNIPLTLDHSSTVTILDEHVNLNDPKDLVSLAKIFGLELRGTWKVEDAHGTTIIDWPVNPSAIVSTSSKCETTPSPLKYVCNMTNMWRGTIKVRLDIVANEFHTGTLQCETMFNRTTDDLTSMSSTYVKQFDLGDGQQSFEYTIPYIYDTPWRRNNIVPDFSVLPSDKVVVNSAPPFDIGQYGAAQYLLTQTALAERCRTYFRVSVINPLTPIKPVAQAIEVLMSIAAGDDFNVHSIMPQQLFRPLNPEGSTQDPPYGRFPMYYWNKNSVEGDPWIDPKKSILTTPQNHSKFEGIAKPKYSQLTDLDGTTARVVVQGDFIDKTLDFTSGIAFRSFHTSDNQLEFKDIMRRNVMILNAQVPKAFLKIKKDKDGNWTDHSQSIIRDEGKFDNGKAFVFGNIKQAYYIPIFCLNQFDARKPFKRCAVSPHAAISSLFRHWRGSIRYVFVFKQVVDSPIYITYMPMTGTVLSGVQQTLTSVKLTVGMQPNAPYSDEESEVCDQIYMAETGMATEVCITRINQTCAVTVPFDTNLNRCVVSKRNRRNINKNAIVARDESSAISGHIVLQCDEEVDFDLFYSVGDDFELSDFIGCSSYSQRVVPLMPDELVQSTSYASMSSGFQYSTLGNKDFQLNSLSSRATGPRINRRRYQYTLENNDINNTTNNNVYGYQIGDVNEISYQMDYIDLASKLIVPATALGTGFFISRNAHRIGNSMRALTSQADSLLESAQGVFDSFGNKASEVKNIVKESLVQVSEQWSTLMPEGMNLSAAVDLVLDIIRLVKNFNYLELSLVILKWASRVFELSVETLYKFKNKLADAVKPLVAYFSQEQNSEKYTNPGVSVFGTLLGIIGTGYGLKDLIKTKKCVDLTDAFKVRMCDFRGLNYFLVAVNFVDYLFKTFQSIMRYIFGYVDPKTEVKTFLAGRSEQIKEFIDNVEIVTSPLNTIMLKKPSFKVKVWKTAIFGINLKKELVKMDPSVACNQLINYCNQIIKFTVDKNTALTCAPTRYEPFVICLEGPSGIGKSSVNMEMICEILSSAGYDMHGVNPTYTRTPGKKHWDGYSGGLSITYDDWMNLTTSEQVSEQIAELYELKSRSFFMPQMADLADKGLSANPRLITLLTNNAFPSVSVEGVTTHVEAVWRRRDVLVKVKSKYDGLSNTLTPEQTQGYAHLLFSYSDPVNEEIINEASGWMDYKTFIADISERFQKYDAKEKLNMQRELQALCKFSGDKTTIFDDPTDILNFYFTKQTMDQIIIPEEYPSNKLRLDLEKIMDKLDEDCLLKPVEIVNQGALDDAINWFWAFFDPERNTKVKRACSHCDESTIFLVTDEDEEEDGIFHGLASHQLCIKCTVSASTCVHCLDRNSKIKKPLRIARGTIIKLASMRKHAVDKYNDWWKKFSDGFAALDPTTRHCLKILCAQLVIIPAMMAAELLGNTIAEYASQGINDEGDLEIEFEQQKFDEAIELEVVSSVTGKCMHELLLNEQGKNVWIYFDCMWRKNYNNGKADKLVHFANCGEGCVLRSEEGKTKYKEWINRNCELSFESYLYHAQRVMDPTSTGIESNDYLAIVPPCYRIANLIVKSQDFFTIVDEDKYACVEELKSWSITFPKWFKNALTIVGIGSAVLGSFLLVSKLIKAFLPATQIISSGSMQTRHFLKNRMRVVKTSRIKTQNHEQLKETLIDKIVRNYIIIEIYAGKNLLTYMVAAGIYNNTAIMPKHYLEKIRNCIKSNNEIKIILTPVRSTNIQVSYAFSEEDFIEAEDTADICIFNMPKTVGMFKDIRGFICKEKDLGSISSSGYLIQVPKKTKSVIREQSIKIHGFRKDVEVRNDSEVMHNLDSLHYNFSENGACGSLVCRDNHTRPILAMHFAGSTNICMYPEGFGVVLTQEMFEDLDSCVGLEEEEVELKPAENAKMLLPASVEVQSIGTIPKAVFMPVKSKIIPSKVQPFLEAPKTEPAFLSKLQPGYPHNDSPLLLGCKKHGELTTNFPTHIVNEVAEALWELKYSNLQPIIANPRHLTYKEAIGGLNLPGYEAIKLDTSMGYPYVLEKETLKKNYIEIMRGEDGEVTHVYVNKNVLEKQIEVDSMRAEGIRPFLPYVDELKDERKKKEKKVKPGSTRVFCMSSIHNTIPVRANFLHFAAAYTAARFDLNHAVGISRNGPEWTKLVNVLSQVSLNNVVTMDYSNFGPGYNLMVNAKGHEIIKKWTLKNVSGVNETELDVLGWEHYNSDHIMNDLVYRQYSGGPSGDALTVVKNGLVNEMYILLAWRYLMGDWCILNDKPIYPTFFKLTKLVTYGDDLIMAIDDSIKNLFNGVTIKNFLAEFKITATDALKTGEDVPYTSILEASFLKSGFKPHPKFRGEWLAPLEQLSVEEVPKWIRQCDNLNEATEQNCEAGLREAFGHGPAFFDETRKVLNEALCNAGLHTIYLTWDELDKNFFKHKYDAIYAKADNNQTINNQYINQDINNQNINHIKQDINNQNINHVSTTLEVEIGSSPMLTSIEKSNGVTPNLE